MAPIRAVLGKAEVTFEDVLKLQVGDVLKLDTRVKEPTVVFVGTKPKFLGRPGLVGRRKAVQLSSKIAKNDEKFYD